MADNLQKRHEERMAEKRRGGENVRAVTMDFGFGDFAPMKATPPGEKPAKPLPAAAATAAAKPVEKPALVSALTASQESSYIQVPASSLEVPPAIPPSEDTPRRSGRLSRGTSVLSTASRDPPTPSSVAAPLSEGGSARKRRRLTQSPARSIASRRRSTSAVPETTVNVPQTHKSNVSATPDVNDDVFKSAGQAALIQHNTEITTPQIRTLTASQQQNLSGAPSSPSPLPPPGSGPRTRSARASLAASAMSSSVSPPPPFRYTSPAEPAPVILESVGEEDDGDTIVEDELEGVKTPRQGTVELIVEGTPDPVPEVEMDDDDAEVEEEEEDTTSAPVAEEPEAGLRAQKGRRGRPKKKPATAAITPVPRGKRKRQKDYEEMDLGTPVRVVVATVSPDVGEVDEEEEADVSVVQVRRAQEVDSEPVQADDDIVEEELVEEEEEEDEVVVERPKPVAVPKLRGRPGRKPKIKRGKKASVEIPVDELPAIEEMNLSDAEPEVSMADEEQQDDEEDIPAADDDDEEMEDMDEDEDEDHQQAEVDEDDEPEPLLPKRTRKPRTSGPAAPRQPRKRRANNETIEITVYRPHIKGASAAEKQKFKSPKGPNPLQIVSEFLLETIDQQLQSISSRRSDEPDKELRAKMKVREMVVKMFLEALETRFIGMADKADMIKVKSVELRSLVKRKTELRDELMGLREQREEVARQADKVRRGHREGVEKAERQKYVSETLKTISAAIEEGEAMMSSLPEEELERNDKVGLEGLLAMVNAEIASGPGGGRGILDQVKDLNKFLERALRILE